jgi:methionine-rich copper-binding protein CopC
VRITCTVRLVTSGRSATVTARRGGKVVARGTVTRSGTVVLRNRAKLRKGRYTLDITSVGKDGRKTVVKRSLVL